eukprot:879543_1
MFEPAISETIENDFVDENLIQMSYDCILPKGDTDLEEITAKDGVTQVFILSFQVFESSKIKCYWYRRSQMSRFFPKDIVSLWSMYFDQITDEKDMDKIKKK